MIDKYFAVYINVGNVSPQKAIQKIEDLKTSILENKLKNEKYFFIPVKTRESSIELLNP